MPPRRPIVPLMQNVAADGSRADGANVALERRPNPARPRALLSTAAAAAPAAGGAIQPQLQQQQQQQQQEVMQQPGPQQGEDKGLSTPPPVGSALTRHADPVDANETRGASDHDAAVIVTGSAADGQDRRVAQLLAANGTFPLAGLTGAADAPPIVLAPAAVCVRNAVARPPAPSSAAARSFADPEVLAAAAASATSTSAGLAAAGQQSAATTTMWTATVAQAATVALPAAAPSQQQREYAGTTGSGSGSSPVVSPRGQSPRLPTSNTRDSIGSASASNLAAVASPPPSATVTGRVSGPTMNVAVEATTTVVMLQGGVGCHPARPREDWTRAGLTGPTARDGSGSDGDDADAGPRRAGNASDAAAGTTAPRAGQSQRGGARGGAAALRGQMQVRRTRGASSAALPPPDLSSPTFGEGLLEPSFGKRSTAARRPSASEGEAGVLDAAAAASEDPGTLGTLASQEQFAAEWRRLQDKFPKVTRVYLCVCLYDDLRNPGGGRGGGASVTAADATAAQSARLECWRDPREIATFATIDPVQQQPQAQRGGSGPGRSDPPATVSGIVSRALEDQYRQLQRDAVQFVHAPDVTDTDFVRRLRGIRSETSESERILVHINAHGVPPTPGSGELFFLNATRTYFNPILFNDIVTEARGPALFIIDRSYAGALVQQFERTLGADPVRARDTIILAACGANEDLPRNPTFPADLFTSCLTTPLRALLKWSAHFSPRLSLLPNLPAEWTDLIPGDLSDRHSPLGELNSILTALLDVIAWSLLPPDRFYTLFRQDMLTRHVVRNFLLADRVMRDLGRHPVSYPPFARNAHAHPLWGTWELVLDGVLAQLPALLQRKNEQQQRLGSLDGSVEGAGVPPPTLAAAGARAASVSSQAGVAGAASESYLTLYRPSTFFADQLTAFATWLDVGRLGAGSSSPEPLPAVVLSLQQNTYRARALLLLARYFEGGRAAVYRGLTCGLMPYLTRILNHPTFLVPGNGQGDDAGAASGGTPLGSSRGKQHTRGFSSGSLLEQTLGPLGVAPGSNSGSQASPALLLLAAWHQTLRVLPRLGALSGEQRALLRTFQLRAADCSFEWLNQSGFIVGYSDSVQELRQQPSVQAPTGQATNQQRQPQQPVAVVPIAAAPLDPVPSDKLTSPLSGSGDVSTSSSSPRGLPSADSFQSPAGSQPSAHPVLHHPVFNRVTSDLADLAGSAASPASGVSTSTGYPSDSQLVQQQQPGTLPQRLHHQPTVPVPPLTPPQISVPPPSAPPTGRLLLATTPTLTLERAKVMAGHITCSLLGYGGLTDADLMVAGLSPWTSSLFLTATAGLPRAPPQAHAVLSVFGLPAATPPPNAALYPVAQASAAISSTAMAQRAAASVAAQMPPYFFPVAVGYSGRVTIEALESAAAACWRARFFSAIYPMLVDAAAPAAVAASAKTSATNATVPAGAQAGKTFSFVSPVSAVASPAGAVAQTPQPGGSVAPQQPTAAAAEPQQPTTSAMKSWGCLAIGSLVAHLPHAKDLIAGELALRRDFILPLLADTAPSVRASCVFLLTKLVGHRVDWIATGAGTPVGDVAAAHAECIGRRIYVERAIVQVLAEHSEEVSRSVRRETLYGLCAILHAYGHLLEPAVERYIVARTREGVGAPFVADYYAAETLAEEAKSHPGGVQGVLQHAAMNPVRPRPYWLRVRADDDLRVSASQSHARAAFLCAISANDTRSWIGDLDAPSAFASPAAPQQVPSSPGYGNSGVSQPESRGVSPGRAPTPVNVPGASVPQPFHLTATAAAQPWRFDAMDPALLSDLRDVVFDAAVLFARARQSTDFRLRELTALAEARLVAHFQATHMLHQQYCFARAEPLPPSNNGFDSPFVRCYASSWTPPSVATGDATTQLGQIVMLNGLPRSARARMEGLAALEASCAGPADAACADGPAPTASRQKSTATMTEAERNRERRNEDLATLALFNSDGNAAMLERASAAAKAARDGLLTAPTAHLQPRWAGSNGGDGAAGGGRQSYDELYTNEGISASFAYAADSKEWSPGTAAKRAAAAASGSGGKSGFLGSFFRKALGGSDTASSDTATTVSTLGAASVTGGATTRGSIAPSMRGGGVGGGATGAGAAMDADVGTDGRPRAQAVINGLCPAEIAAAVASGISSAVAVASRSGGAAAGVKTTTYIPSTGGALSTQRDGTSGARATVDFVTYPVGSLFSEGGSSTAGPASSNDEPRSAGIVTASAFRVLEPHLFTADTNGVVSLIDYDHLSQPELLCSVNLAGGARSSVVGVVQGARGVALPWGAVGGGSINALHVVNDLSSNPGCIVTTTSGVVSILAGFVRSTSTAERPGAPQPVLSFDTYAAVAASVAAGGSSSMRLARNPRTPSCLRQSDGAFFAAPALNRVQCVALPEEKTAQFVDLGCETVHATALAAPELVHRRALFAGFDDGAVRVFEDRAPGGVLTLKSLLDPRATTGGSYAAAAYDAKLPPPSVLSVIPIAAGAGEGVLVATPRGVALWDLRQRAIVQYVANAAMGRGPAGNAHFTGSVPMRRTAGNRTTLFARDEADAAALEATFARTIGVRAMGLGATVGTGGNTGALPRGVNALDVVTAMAAGDVVPGAAPPPDVRAAQQRLSRREQRLAAFLPRSVRAFHGSFIPEATTAAAQRAAQAHATAPQYEALAGVALCPRLRLMASVMRTGVADVRVVGDAAASASTGAAAEVAGTVYMRRFAVDAQVLSRSAGGAAVGGSGAAPSVVAHPVKPLFAIDGSILCAVPSRDRIQGTTMSI